MVLRKPVSVMVSVFCFAGVTTGAWVMDTVVADPAGYETTGAIGFGLAPDGTMGVSLKHSEWATGFYGIAYASSDGGDWTTEWARAGEYAITIANSFSALAFDGNSVPHIAYIDLMGNTINYCTKNGTTWEYNTAVTERPNAGNIAIACDNNNLPHVAYITATSTAPRLVSYDGSNWTTDTLPEGMQVYYDITLAFDNSNNPHIVAGQGVHYSRSGSTWEVDTIKGVELREARIAFDSQGDIHVGGYDDDGTDPELVHATWSGTDWTVETLNDHAWHASFALDAGGNLHYSYRTFDLSADDVLMYGTNSGGSWASESIDSSAQSLSAHLAIGADGTAHIVGIKIGSSAQIYHYTNGASGIGNSFRSRFECDLGLRIVGDMSVRYALERPSRVVLSVFDVQGTLVGTLVDAHQAAGTHLVRWDGTGMSNEPLASGTYVCRLEIDGVAGTRKVHLSR